MSPHPNEGAGDRSWQAIIGWGALAVFSAAFLWNVRTQLGEQWSKRSQDAISVTRELRPDGSRLSLQDLVKQYALDARRQGRYVSEFTWDAAQTDGPNYRVTLVWREGGEHKQATWLVSLSTKEVRPQGEEAALLASRVQATVDGS